MQPSEGGSGAPGLRPRIEALSDLVFGLALSVGSIILISRTVASSYDLVSDIALFGFSFLIIIWIWSGYTRIMILLPAEVRGTFVLNIALLFCVAIEPYLFYVLFSAPFSVLDFSSSVYAIDAGAMMFILAGLTHMFLSEEKKLTVHRLSPVRMMLIRRIMGAELVAGTIFAFSALPFMWVLDPDGFSYLRFECWYGSFIAFFFVSVSRRRSVPEAPARPRETSTLGGGASYDPFARASSG